MLVAQGNLAGDGRQTVTTPGTAVALAAATRCMWVLVTALAANTQQVNVGTATVLAAAGTERGVPLTPGESTVLPVTDISTVFVDARVAGEGVAYAYGV